MTVKGDSMSKKAAAVTSVHYMMTMFNTLFSKDVDMAYEFLKQELRAKKIETSVVPVRLSGGQTIMVDVGTTSPPKLKFYKARANI